ncbi:MAG: hypothetical protein MJZ92_00205 [Paludibacteraceae bacterium]|nr:hypothetical protein [Paludibacteraceae bacterium]
MRKLLFLIIVMGGLCACDTTPTTLTVVNHYPSGYVKVLKDGATDSTLEYRSYTAMVYYGMDHILTVEPQKTVKRKLEGWMMNRPVKRLQVELINSETFDVVEPLFFNEQCKFVSDMTYTLTITKDGCKLEKQMVEIQQ